MFTAFAPLSHLSHRLNATLQAASAAEQHTIAAQPTAAGDSAAYERRAVAEDDVVIVSSCRTALCKAKRGGFKDTPVDDLIAAVLKETIRRTGVEPEVRVRGEAVVVVGSVFAQIAGRCRCVFGRLPPKCAGRWLPTAALPSPPPLSRM